MSKNNKQNHEEEIVLELQIDDQESEMIVKLKKIIESSSHKLPTKKNNN